MPAYSGSLSFITGFVHSLSMTLNQSISSICIWWFFFIPTLTWLQYLENNVFLEILTCILWLNVSFNHCYLDSRSFSLTVLGMRVMLLFFFTVVFLKFIWCVYLDQLLWQVFRYHGSSLWLNDLIFVFNYFWNVKAKNGQSSLSFFKIILIVM